MKVLTFDIECQNHKYLERVASPFCEDNYIVEIAWNFDGGEVQSERFEENHRTDVMVDAFNSLEKGDIINGFNTKFDLLWVWHQPCVQQALKRGARIWCGQLAEYLLKGMGQDVQMNNMNTTSAHYGGGTKVDAVKEMWQAGVLTADIPPDLLHDYLCGTDDIVGDVPNTWLIYVGQLEVLKNFPPETTTMINNRMESLLATTEMEYNGLYVNSALGDTIREELTQQIDELFKELGASLPILPENCVFNWASVYDKSALLYGGTKKYSQWVQHTDEEGNGLYANKTVAVYQDRVYKSGKRAGEKVYKNEQQPDLDKPKGAQRDHFYTFPGITSPKGIKRSTLTTCKDEPIYSSDADTIDKLGNRGIPFLTALSQHAKFVKDRDTYYWTEDKNGKRKGMLTTVGPDGLIHHGLNHTSTVTGRMSSSKPNLQNLPRKGTSKVKQMFESRFGDDGYIVEMDYSALEVYVQAIMMNETSMMKQIESGIDFHCYRLSLKLGEDYEQVVEKCKNESHPEYKKYDAMRTAVKGFSFQLAYGAGAAAIADSTGMTVEEVKVLMENEAKAYPALAKFDERLAEHIKDSYQMTSKVTPVNGINLNVGIGHWFSPTGTRFQWEEKEAPDFLKDRGQMLGFSPTERKNYPVQGFGGEIMQTMLGVLYRWFISKDFQGKALLVNTVHDSCYLDIHKDYVHEVVPMATKILSMVRNKFNNDFDLGIPIDFKVDADLGQSMFISNGYNATHTY